VQTTTDHMYEIYTITNNLHWMDDHPTFNLNTVSLQNTMRQIHSLILPQLCQNENLSEGDATLFCCVLLSIWKQRNKSVEWGNSCSSLCCWESKNYAS